MKTLKGILFAVTILCLAYAGWAQGQGNVKDESRGPKMRKGKDLIEFLDQKGVIKKRIQLGRKEEWKEVKTKSWKGKMGAIEDVKGNVSENGLYAGLISCKADSTEGWGVTSSTCVFKYLDDQGNTLWEKKGVGNSSPYLSIAANGKRVLLVEDQSPSPASGLELFPHKPRIYDEQGKIVWDFDSYDEIDDFKLTKNGKYGFFKYTKIIVTDSRRVSEMGVLFFDVDNQKMDFYKFNKNHIAGSADISEEGKAILYTVEDEILDASVHPFKVKTIRHVFYEHQF